jgi:hypothetical protein
MSAVIISNTALQSLRFTKRYSVAKKGLSFVYPSDLFELRSEIRDYSEAPRDVTLRAERMAVSKMLKGVPRLEAVKAAKTYLWHWAIHGYTPGSAA